MRQSDLPIVEVKSQLLAALGKQRRLILTAPTGSGKSTQVPQMLLDGGLLGEGQVVVLQPRRLPTRLLAAWVAQQRGGKVGDEVGYQIRFDDVTSRRTRIRYVTEGVLLRQILGDPTLRGVNAILFDEFHERHLYGDITLARALQIQETVRPDLLLVVMSATLDTGPLQKYLASWHGSSGGLGSSQADATDPAAGRRGSSHALQMAHQMKPETPPTLCEILSSEGRTFPVDIEYLAKPVAALDKRGHNNLPIWEVAARELQRLVGKTEGDALVFMPGAYEISRTVQAVRDTLGSQFLVLPLHGDLPTNDQDAAVARYDHRKIVVSTNVAETSLTIDGVRIVVDSGLARIARYDPHRGINTLLIEKISRASADQRAGRAGRTAPGVCLRLWTEREHEQRLAQELPEVKRLDLAEVVLTLKASSVEDIKSFRWLEPPDPKALERAEELLVDLGAVVGRVPSHGAVVSRVPSRGAASGDAAYSMRITDLGRRMLAFPLHPRYSRMLLAAQELGCVRPIALIAALTQGRDLLVRGQGKQVAEARDELFGGETESDFFVLMRAWRFAERNGFNVERCRRLGIHAQSARQVGPLFEQFLDIARREGLDITEKPMSREAVAKCLLLGFSDHVTRRLDVGTLRCELVHGRRGLLARESVVSSPLLVAAEVAEVQGRELNVVLNFATAIKEEWLQELSPEDFQRTEDVVYDETQRRVFVERRKVFRDLVLEKSEAGSAARPSGSGAMSDGAPDLLSKASALFAAEVLKGNLVLKNWDDAVEQWILRVNWLREWMPELELPGIGDDDRQAIIQQICHGATNYKEIKDRPVWPVAKSWLSKPQQELVDQHAPERIELKSGRRAKVTYSADGPPTLAARIQDLYGTKSLTIAAGRVPIRIQVLAPNNRPVQVTENLSLFWRETYPKLKQELQRKYPKHEWR